MSTDSGPHETALLSPGGTSIFSLNSSVARLVVGTVDGIWILCRASDGEWDIEHRALAGTFVSSLTRMSDGALVAGTHHLGAAISRDDGRTWKWINKGLSQFDIWVMKAERLQNRDVLIAGTMPAHLFISEDAETWRELTSLRNVPTAEGWFFPPPPHLGHVKDAVVTAKGDLLVGIEVGALLRSHDQGESFEELPVDPDYTEIDIHRLLVHPDRPKRIVAATGWGLKISTDQGSTWQRLDAAGINYPDAMVMHPDDPDFMIVAGAVGYPPNWYKINRARPRIARSNDGGKTWDRLLGGFPNGQRAAIGAMTLAASSDSTSIFIGDTDGQVFLSEDKGESWKIIYETGAVSKGEHYRGLMKGRPPMADLDELRFAAQGQNRVENAKA